MHEHATEQAGSAGAPEESLWRAVIAGAIDEWLHGPLRKQREAEQYLFDDTHDFPIVSQHAGVNAKMLRARLNRLRTKGVAQQPLVREEAQAA